MQGCCWVFLTPGLLAELLNDSNRKKVNEIAITPFSFGNKIHTHTHTHKKKNFQTFFSIFRTIFTIPLAVMDDLMAVALFPNMRAFTL